MTDLSASLEDYIEAIYNLGREKEAARVKDIAGRLGVKKGSVTGALHSLSERDLINYTPYEVVTLTAKGKRVAKDVVYRHRTLADFFVKVLSIDGKEAEDAACEMEHAVSRHVLNRLADFAEFVEECPRAGQSWLQRFKKYERSDVDKAECRRCIDRCLKELENEY